VQSRGAAYAQAVGRLGTTFGYKHKNKDYWMNAKQSEKEGLVK